MKWLALAVMFYFVYVAMSGSSATLPQETTKTTTPQPPAIPMGDWKTGHYVDEFGDKTTDGFVSLTTNGSFSNSATEDAALRVRMFINAGSREPWFRLYEYAGKNPVKGIHTDLSLNMLRCRIKAGEMEPFNAYFNQRQGSDYFWLDDRELSKLGDAVVAESSLKASCYHVDIPTTKYKFAMDFSHFANAMAKAEGKSTDA
jgi:hypothetical protein